MTDQPQPLDAARLREEILAALSAAGAFCGACGFEPGEIGCADCVRVRELYADAIAPITDRLTADLQQAQQQAAMGDRALRLLLHYAAEAHGRKWQYDTGEEGAPSPAFAALYQLGNEMNAAYRQLTITAAVSGA